MKTNLNKEQIIFILEEYQGKLYNFYNDEIKIHTLKDSKLFESLENKIKGLISVVKQTDTDIVVLENEPLTVELLKTKLLEFSDVIERDYNSKEMLFTDDVWDKLINSLE